MQKSQRLTVRSHNIQFLEALASQMGIDDLSEALNYLLLDCKGLGYVFGSKPAPQPQQPQIPIGYAFDPSTFDSCVAPIPEVQRNYQEIDPIIARFANLIEEF